MGGTLENGIYLPDQGERNCYNGLKNNWDTLDGLIETVQALSSAGLTREIVNSLPTDNIKTNVIYMLRNSQQSGDLYDEYMYINNAWEPIGTSATEMDNYYTKSETNDLPAVKSGITASKVSGYDTHVANTDVHVTTAEKTVWDGKQNALDTAQTAAVNSGVNATKVTGYDTHVSDTDIHVTSSDKTAWNAKQDGLSQTQLNAVNSGVTDTKVTGYDTHVADSSAHVSSADRTAWNGKQDALSQTQLDNIAAVPDKVNSADLATVATTGDYGDLLNAPTIPTVNNATLTIQKNGTDVATFTANASSNVTANLAIPTDTSDLTNGAGFLTQHNPVDDELSVSSENAVQNKVVTAALGGKASSVHTHAASDVDTGTFNIARIPNLDASKITSGTIDIARLPKGSLERLVKVADQTARFALTTDDVQLGDTVQQLDTGVMYAVTDETKLDSADGYTEFTAGSATSVPWSGVTGKPSSYTPASHSHGNITNDGKVGTVANKPLITGTNGVVQAGSFGDSANTFCEGNDSRLSDARTPVAHTHTKSDVTDLFNSANAWTALNTYSNGQIKIKSQSQEIGVTPSSGVIQYLEFADKNDAQHGIVGLWDYSNGASELQMYITDKFKNGAKDPTGTSESTILSFGFKADGSKFLTFSGQVDNPVIPKSSGTYDIGSSAYIWNNVYAKNYYYNGVAWGLDKSNVWSGDNSFTSSQLTLKNSNITRGTIPNVNRNYVLNFTDRNNDNVGMIFQQVRTGSGSYKMTFSLNNGTTDHRFNFFGFTDGTSSLIPEVSGVTELGSSDYKWKTLNGINPGALSLPDYNNYLDVTSNIPVASLDGTQIDLNTYLADKTGWLSIVIADTAGNCITVTQGRAGGSTVFNNSRTFHTGAQSNGCISVFFPIIASMSKFAFIKASSLIQMRFYYCLGNV